MRQLLVLFLVLSGGGLFAQENMEQAHAMVKKFADAYLSLDASDHVHLKTTVITSGLGREASSQNVEYWFDHKRSIIKMQWQTIYTENHTSFIVDHEEKEIHVIHNENHDATDGDQLKSLHPERFTVLPDKEGTVLTLSVDTLKYPRAPMTQVDYYLKNGTVIKTKTTLRGAASSSLTVLYTIAETSFEMPNASKNYVALFLDNNKKLNSQWKGYSLLGNVNAIKLDQ